MAPRSPRSPATRWVKIALCWIALVFALQLINSTQHRHDLAGTAPDCPSCLACHLPATLPGAEMALAAGPAMLLYALPLATGHAYQGTLSFLIPHAHAPPVLRHSA